MKTHTRSRDRYATLSNNAHLYFNYHRSSDAVRELGERERERELDKSSKDFAGALMYFFPINKTPWALKQA